MKHITNKHGSYTYCQLSVASQRSSAALSQVWKENYQVSVVILMVSIQGTESPVFVSLSEKIWVLPQTTYQQLFL